MFLRTGSKLNLKSSMIKTYQLAVELCWIATTDQGHEKEFLNIILLHVALSIRILTSGELDPNWSFFPLCARDFINYYFVRSSQSNRRLETPYAGCYDDGIENVTK